MNDSGERGGDCYTYSHVLALVSSVEMGSESSCNF